MPSADLCGSMDCVRLGLITPELMWAKFGLIFIVAAALAFAFVAGVVAPPSIAESVKNLVKSAGTLFPSAETAQKGIETAVNPKSDQSATKPGASSAGGVVPLVSPTANTGGASDSRASADKQGGNDTVLLSSLFPPINPVANSTYALLVGQFAFAEPARQLSASINGQGVSSTIIQAKDDAQINWAVVTAGKFSSESEARAQRSHIANKLNLSQPLSVILLPPPAVATTPPPAQPTVPK